MTSPRPQVSNVTARCLFQLVEPIAARTEGRALYAAVRTLPVPTEPLARFRHANLLRS